MSAFVLKILACITMFIDHVSYIIPGETYYLNYIGRLAFPIFAFQISEGYIHTRNLKKYMFRLFIFALISQIPFMLFHTLINEDFLVVNVIFTLLFGLISILVFDKCNKFLGLLATILLGIIAQALKFDYGFYGVSIVFLFYLFKEFKIISAISYLVATTIYFTSMILAYGKYGTEILLKAFDWYLPFAICTMCAIIPIVLYNNKKGPNTKYLIYLFYPLHLILIYAYTIIF